MSNIVTPDRIPFRDIVDTAWYALYIQQAYWKGIIQSAERFRPDDYISRGEAAVVLDRALRD